MNVQTNRSQDTSTVFGTYHLLRRLGAGGMGVVYEVVDPERGSRLALKALHRLNPHGIVRFKNEFRRAADLSHRNLIRLYELNVVDETWFVTMELVDGVDFRTYVEQARASGPALTPGDDKLRAAIRQLATGLDALHDAGLLHLDLKPTNVMVDATDRVVILDFGLSKPTVPDPAASEDKELVATPLYLSPEQVAGAQPTQASDWYAFGLLLFEVLTGEAPFPGSIWESLGRRTQEPAPAPSSRRRDVPADLDALCVALLERDPAARPTGAEVLERLGGVSAVAHPRPPLVGRKAELDKLLGLHAQAWPGKSLYVHLRGPSGVGKSALARHFLEQLRGLDAPLILSGRCYEWESVPYKGLDPVIDTLARHLDNLSPSDQQTLLDADLHLTARLFPVLRGCRALRSFQPPSTLDLEPLELRRRAFAALKRVFTRLGTRQRVVLFLDDLQWGDADGAVLLAELLSAPNPPPIFVLATYRPDEALDSPFFRELGALRAAQAHLPEAIEIDVEPLTLDDAAELAAAFAGDRLSADDAKKIARESAGNAFFIEELSRPEAGVFDDDQRTLSVGRVVHTRVERLPSDARQLLRTLAVAGRPLGQDTLFEAIRTTTRDPWGALAHLRAERLVRTRGPRSTDLVEAYHDRIRESVMAELEPATLPGLHGALAQAMLASHRVEPEILAHHFCEAGELERATEQALVAAEAADAAFAFERAAALYARAVGWGKIAGDRLHEWRGKQGRALVHAGRTGEAAPVLLDAAQTAPASERRELQRQAVEAYLVAGHTDRGLEAAKPLLEDLGIAYPSSPLRAVTTILRQMLRLQFERADHELTAPVQVTAEQLATIDVAWSLGKGLMGVMPLEAVSFALRSLVGARAAGDRLRIARSLAFIGSGCSFAPGWLARKGQEYLERAEAIAVELDDPYLRGLTQVWYTYNDLFTGRWRALHENASRALQMLESCRGVHLESTVGATQLLLALDAMGQMTEVRERAQERHAEAVRRGDLYTQVVFAQFIGYCSIASGDIADARGRARWALQHWTRKGYTLQQAYSMRIEAYCDLYEGDPSAALARIDKEWAAIERSKQLMVPMTRMDLLLLRGRAHLALAAKGRARAHLKACEAIARRLHAEPVRREGKAHATLLRAGLALVSADPRLAASLLARAAASYERLDMKLFAACTRRRWAELRGDEALMATEDSAIRSCGVFDPARWLRVFAPGFEDALKLNTG